MAQSIWKMAIVLEWAELHVIGMSCRCCPLEATEWGLVYQRPSELQTEAQHYDTVLRLLPFSAAAPL